MEELDLMKRIYRVGDTAPFEVLPSGHKAWLLAKVRNLSAIVYESQQMVELPSPCHADEETIYVLEGRVEFADGRICKASEAVYNLPNVAHPGHYAGRLLIGRATPNAKVKLDANLMKRVFKNEDFATLYVGEGTFNRRLWLATENLSLSIMDANPGVGWNDPGHEQPEIIYAISGNFRYDDGRTVGPGDAIINIPNVPHPGKRLGNSTIRTWEVRSPATPKLLEMLKELQRQKSNT